MSYTPSPASSSPTIPPPAARLGGIVLALVVATGLFGCKGKPERLVIGVALTRNYHPGIILALEELNAAGGIRGIPVETVGLDWTVLNEYDPREAMTWANRFAEIDDLVAVIGHSDSASTLASAAYYNQFQVPHIVTIATNPAISDIGPWTYRLCPTDTLQGNALAEYAVNDWGKQRAAVFYVDDDFGRSLAEIFQARFRDLGGQVVTMVPQHNVLQDEDRQLLERSLGHLVDLGFSGEGDLVVILQRQRGADEIITGMAGLPITPCALGADPLGIPWMAAHAHREGIDLRASLFFYPGQETPRTASFVATFRESTGREPDYGDAYTYDAVHLLKEAILAGAGSRRGVKEGLDSFIRAGTVLDGVVGSYLIGEDNDARRSFTIGALEDGVFRPIEPVRPLRSH